MWVPDACPRAPRSRSGANLVASRTRHAAEHRLDACDACDGSPSTCRLDVELIPVPSRCIPMDTNPKEGSCLLLFRAFVHNVTWSASARRRASSGKYVTLCMNPIHRMAPGRCERFCADLVSCLGVSENPADAKAPWIPNPIHRIAPGPRGRADTRPGPTFCVRVESRVRVSASIV